MEKFDILTGTAAPMMDDNINTDAIIPTAWIVNVGSDWGRGLFGNWRRGRDGKDLPDFVLNRPKYRDCRILVAGRNFACGSSREEAVWALLGFGIRCVIAPSFGDIFFDSAFKNGLLPVVLPVDRVKQIAASVDAGEQSEMTVDLVRCSLTAPDGTAIAFTVDETRRAPLLQGRDDIDRTLALVSQIEAFQSADKTRRPWIYRS